MRSFRQFCAESNENFEEQIKRLVPEIVSAAQHIYDEWEGGNDPVYGSGGICDDISKAIGNLIVSRIPDADVFEGGQDGDDHAYVIAYKNGLSYIVDIPYSIYERGGGYNWSKIPGVKFIPRHVVIEPTDYTPEGNS